MVPDVEGTQFWTFEAVQERLVEAMLLWRRMPDRERGWLAVKAYWPDLRRHNHFGDYADAEATPRPLPLSRAEIRRMEEASEWLLLVNERDRALVALAVAWLAGGRSQVPGRTSAVEGKSVAIRGWSSDVCSSDVAAVAAHAGPGARVAGGQGLLARSAAAQSFWRLCGRGGNAPPSPALPRGDQAHGGSERVAAAGQ